MGNKQITLSERFFTGLLSAGLMAIMAVCVPIGLVVLSRGRGLNMLIVFGSFHIWGMSLIVVSGIVGAALGADRATVIFGHLWGTESPNRIDITLALWLILVGVGLISYWAFGAHHAL